MGLQHEFYRGVNYLKDGGQAALNAAKNFSPKEMFTGSIPSPTPAGGLERGFLKMMKYGVGMPLKGALSVANWSAGILAKPFVWLTAIPKVMFTKFPNASIVGVVVGGATIIGSYFAKSRSEALIDQYAMAQDAAIQAAAAQQSFTPQETFARAQAQGPYTNSATYADVQKKMDADRAAGIAPISQEAALAARQQAPIANVSAL